MPTQQLPSDPSLENLRKQAKSLHQAVLAADAGAVTRVRELHPRASEAIATFALSDAQLVVARTYGFASWPKLKEHVTVVEHFHWEPPRTALADEGSPSNRFVRLACLDYGDWHPTFAAKARRMLAEEPDLARVDLYAAATAGDVAAVRTMLDRDPVLVNEKGGVLGWEPLLYACYSRLDSADTHHSTLEVARLLLARGADPNAGFLWGGNVPPFTALTGVFGEGENGNNQPPHRDRDAMAELLLDAGADANDGQTLYNLHFRESDHHLELLFAHGLGQNTSGPWFRLLGDRMQSPARMLIEELWSAARKNYFARVKLLVAHGVDVNTPGLRDGRTPAEAAMRAGRHEIAEFLLQHGASRIELEPGESFAAACIAGRREEARAFLDAHPEHLQKLGHHGRIELLHRAVEGNQLEGVRLMVELGFELGRWTRHDGVGINLDTTPMHNAAWAGNLAMVQLLLELGGDPTARDPQYHSTPLAWAAHNQQHHVIDALLPFANIFDAVHWGGVERVAALLRENPSSIHDRDDEGDPLVFYLLGCDRRLEEMFALLRSHGAGFDVRHHSGKSLIEMAEERGADQLVRLLREQKL